MFYTTEEAAIVCGFLNLYLDRASVDVSVRRRNAAFQLGAATETLQRKRCSQRTTDGRRKFSTSLSPVGGNCMRIIEPWKMRF